MKELNVKAFVSFYHEHGVYAKKHILEKLDLKIGDPIGLNPLGGAIPHVTIDCVCSIDEISLIDEALMLLSLFDALASNHYYFLCEFGFTERIAWSPKQYDYLHELEPFDIAKDKKERKIFLSLYREIEENWLDFTMGLRQKGIEPSFIFSDEASSIFPKKELAKLKKEIEHIISKNANSLANFLKEVHEKADVIIGCGSFLSTKFLPLKQAYLISGFNPGSIAYTHDHRRIIMNPFIFYWLVTSVFCLQGRRRKLTPRILQLDITPLGELKPIPVTRLKIRTYSPSRVYIPTFFKDEQSVISDIRSALWKFALGRKKFVAETEFIAPFSAPSLVQEVNLAHSSNMPYLDSTPYGILTRIYWQVIPQISEASSVEIEFFESPLQTGASPAILDTNIVDVGYFPYLSTSPFFSMFLKGREVIIPSVVIYELLRKVEVGKEKERAIKALMRLQELDARGIIKLQIIGETPPEVATQEILTRIYAMTKSKKAKSVKKIRSDIRDALIIQEALKRNAYIFTNDEKLRTLAFLLGVPSIKYHPLVEDVRMIAYNLCKQMGGSISMKKLIEAVKQYAKETRAETYTDEDIRSALSYLSLTDRKIRISHDKIYVTQD